MNIKRKSRIEKLEMSFRDLAIVYISELSYFHDLAILKTRKSLKARKAEIAPFPENPSSEFVIEKLRETSMTLKITKGMS